MSDVQHTALDIASITEPFTGCATDIMFIPNGLSRAVVREAVMNAAISVGVPADQAAAGAMRVVPDAA